MHNECCKDSKVKDWTFAQTRALMKCKTRTRGLAQRNKQLGKEYEQPGLCVKQEALSVDKLTTNLPSSKAALNNPFLSHGTPQTNNQTL